MAMEGLILIANPGGASRKYALFAGTRQRGQLHFEHDSAGIICTLQIGSERTNVPIAIGNLAEAAGQVLPILRGNQLLKDQDQIEHIGLRIVAPGGYFLENRTIDDDFVSQLEAVQHRAPLHISGTLQELAVLRESFPGTPIMGISDSAFHITKPDYAWNYGISLEDADQLDIKRFGYHGLSAASAVHTLKHAHKLPPRVILCHIGSDVSVMAIHAGQSMDTTMGYSPLEGVIMATRSGSIDPAAVRTLREELHLDEKGTEMYLSRHGGLLGLGGASDVRELLRREAAGDHRAHLALQTYVFAIKKAVGQMTAALGGIDLLAFSGTVGERSPPIRKRILEHMHYLDIVLDGDANDQCKEPTEATRISRLAHSKPIFVIPADEAAEMARQVTNTTGQ